MEERRFGISTPPVEEGAEYDVKIDSLGRKGDGITHIEGFVVFVPGVSVGDEVKIRITRVGQRFAFAEVISE